jgi:F0F1-type ATP synthase assembly protein I
VAAEVKQATVAVWGRRALVLVIAGLLLQIGAAFRWSPAMFVVSAAIGLPCVLLGAVVFAVSAWRARGEGESR